MRDEKLRLRESFEKFDRENPKVYRLFKQIAFEMIDAGHDHIGGKMIWEVIRYKTSVRRDARKRGELKLNNNHTAYYVRKFCAQFIGHTAKFETRKVKDSSPASGFIDKHFKERLF